MAYSIINRSKWGSCCQCGAEDTEVVKVAKSTYCISCHKLNKANEQLEKQKQRNALRSDGTKVRGLAKEVQEVDSLQELIIDLDRVYSRWLRISAMQPDHRVECFTCGVKKKWQDIHCGHFVNRQHLGLRWEPMNTKPQCPNCNVTLRGNIKVFAEKLNQERKGLADQLLEMAREVAKPTKNELKELLSNYQFKLMMVEKAKGLK